MDNKVTRAVVMDTETTGFGVKADIIQLCIMVVDWTDGDVKVSIHNDLCSTESELTIGAMTVNHITPEMLEGASRLEDTKSFTELMKLNNKSSVLIAQNGGFDLDFLGRHGFVCNMRYVDTLRVSEKILPNMKKHNLQYARYFLGLYKQEKELAEKYNLKNIEAHDAMGDVIVTYLFFLHLKSLVPLDELMAISGDPSPKKKTYDKFPFGKYKGKDISWIAKNNKGYLTWCLLNLKDMEAEFIQSIKHELSKVAS